MVKLPLILFSIILLSAVSGYLVTTTHPIHENTTNLATLDPLINLSNSTNVVPGLHQYTFTLGKNLTLAFFSTNISYQSVHITVPKYAIISFANYTNYGANFTGNIAFTPSASTSFPTSHCTTNHTLFNGYVLVNNVNTSETNANFTGGLFTISGSCTSSVSTGNSCASPGSPYPSSSCQSSTTYATPTCTVTLNCNPSTTCCTSETQSVSVSCPSPTGGGSCTAPSGPSTGTYQTGTTGYQSISANTQETCSYASTSQCSSSPSTCSYNSLSYSTNTKYCNYGTQGQCSNTNYETQTCQIDTGTTSNTAGSCTISIPVQGINGLCQDAYESSNVGGTIDPGQSVTCPSGEPAADGGGCVDLANTGTTINAGNGYTCPGTTASNCPSGTIPQNDYYYGEERSGSCTTNGIFTSGQCTTSGGCAETGFYSVTYGTTQCRVDYPRYDTFANTYYSGSLTSSSTTGSVTAGNAGMCFDQDTVATVYTGPGSSSGNSNSCSYTNNCASCSPNPVTYNCANDYNSSTPNYCLSSTSGKIVYSAACPSPGTGTLSSPKSITNSCFNNYINTAVSSLNSTLSGTAVMTHSAKLYKGQTINVTIKNALASFLASCTASNGNCTVNINTSSKTSGTLGFEKLNITFGYNVSALYNKSQTQLNVSNSLASRLIPFFANRTLGYGSLLTAINQPFNNISINGFYSKVNCQLQIGNSLYNFNKNASNICPIKTNITMLTQFQEYRNDTQKIIVYNKQAKPVVQTSNGAISQDTALVSTPGQLQYINVPIKFIDNQSKYGVSSTLEVNANIPTINSFNLASGQASQFNMTSNTTKTLVYSANAVHSTQTSIGSFASWKVNTVKIEDQWNNTSPYPFTNLTKTYLLSKGSKFKECLINNTNVTGTNQCTVTNNANGTISVKIVDTSALPAGKGIDPSVISQAPNITLTQTSFSANPGQALNYLIKSTNRNVPVINSTEDVLTSTAKFNNTGSFVYSKINLSASIPQALVSNSSAPISVTYGSTSAFPYFINYTSGIINWTTSNFAGNSIESWIITVTGKPIKVNITDSSTSSIFLQKLNFTVPDSLTYDTFTFQEDTPFLTQYKLCTSSTLSDCVTNGPLTGTPFVLSSSIPSAYFKATAASMTGANPVWITGSIGQPPTYKLIYTNQTNISVGQNIEYYQEIQYHNNNSIALPEFTSDYPMPSSAFSISIKCIGNTSVCGINNNTFVPSSLYAGAPVVNSSQSGFFVPLAASYTPKGNVTFWIKYQIQPLTLSYTPIYPAVIYTDQNAEVLVNISLFNNGETTVKNASYAIPIDYGTNATFYINNILVTNASTVRGYMHIYFPSAAPHTTTSGIITYFIPTVSVTQETNMTFLNSNRTTFFPFIVSSIAPVPLKDVIFTVNTTFAGARVCKEIQNVFIGTLLTDTSGTNISFTCNSQDSLASLDLGAFNLGESKIVIIKLSGVLNTPASNGTLNYGVINTPVGISIILGGVLLGVIYYVAKRKKHG